MSKINIVFWTQGGNTQMMAEAIADGVREAGKEAEVVFVSSITPDALKDEPVFALGCPAMGAEVLEEAEMEPFVAEVEGFAAGKKIALFGSYGWGDGEWMRDWEARMQSAGAELVGGAGLMCHETPDAEGLEEKNIAHPAFVNVNDGTNEGMAYNGKNIFTVQFHPEACPGPQDSSYLFDRFMDMMGGNK